MSQHFHNHNYNQDLQQDMKKIKEILAKTAYDVKGKAGEMLQNSFEDVKNKSLDVEEYVVDYIRENPLKSVAFSALAGVILAKLLDK